MKYTIFIEGRWNADSRYREQKEKEKTKSKLLFQYSAYLVSHLLLVLKFLFFPIGWVNWIVSQLQLCEGIRSSAHPESNRDQVSSLGMGKKPPGWYNFSEQNGNRLLQVKQKRDPKKIFSLTSRVSWASSSESGDNMSSASAGARITCVKTLKDGEVNPTECLSLRKRKPFVNESFSSTDSTAAHSISESDEEKNGISIKIEPSSIEAEHDALEEKSVSSDLKRLLSISSGGSDEDIENWSLLPEPLTKFDFEGDSF